MKDLKIEDFLSVGHENPKTSRELSDLLNISQREVRRLVQEARLQKIPICASCVDNPGYYIARNKKDMSRYLQALQRRMDVLDETFRGCAGSVEALPD